MSCLLYFTVDKEPLSPVSETAEDSGSKKTDTTVSTRVETVSGAESESGCGAVSASVDCTDMKDGSDRVISADREAVSDDNARPELHSTSASSSTGLPSGHSTGTESDSPAMDKKTSQKCRRRSSEKASSCSAEASPKRQKFQRETDSDDSASREQMSL